MGGVTRGRWGNGEACGHAFPRVCGGRGRRSNAFAPDMYNRGADPLECAHEGTEFRCWGGTGRMSTLSGCASAQVCAAVIYWSAQGALLVEGKKGRAKIGK